MSERFGQVTANSERLGVLKEIALMDAIHALEYDRDKYEDVGMYRKAAELDRSKRIIKKMRNGEL